jgi:TetR/AcrR family transcriptional repressor of nem operon
MSFRNFPSTVKNLIPVGIFYIFAVFNGGKNMSKAEKTRQFIIEKTAPIFNIKGYAGTSISDITEATGLTKGSVYGNFVNKNEIAVAVFEYNAATLNKSVADSLAGLESAMDRLIGCIEYYRTNWRDLSEKGGCAILNAAVEADDNLPFLKKSVQDTVHSWAARLAKTIESGKKSGEFRQDVQSLEHAYNFIALIEGGIMISKITENHLLLFNALDRVEKIIHEELKA